MTKNKALKLSSQEYFDSASKSLLADHKDLNSFNLSSIDKISINVGVGYYKNDSKARSDIEKYLTKLTGQKPKAVAAKLSIAGFKLRKGEQVGFAITLRGKKMQDFLLNLIYIALPRSRDFKGIKAGSFDKNYRSYSLGLPSGSIFPIIGFDIPVKFGMQINIVFKADGEINKELLHSLNFPFEK